MRDVVPPLRGLLAGGGFIWYPKLGLGFLTGASTADQEIAAAIRKARGILALTIEAAPLAVRKLANSWGEPGAALPLMHAMKQRFDPARRLSPGRFVGGI
jgi:glycolate oxidase FAD binding subunit